MNFSSAATKVVVKTVTRLGVNHCHEAGSLFFFFFKKKKFIFYDCSSCSLLRSAGQCSAVLDCAEQWTVRIRHGVSARRPKNRPSDS